MSLRNWRYLTTAILTLVLLSVSSLSWAKFTHKVSVDDQENGSYAILVSGRCVIRLQCSNGDISAKERVQIAADRLSCMLKKGLDPKALTTKTVGRNTHLLAGESLIVVATARDAKVENVTADQLAEKWIRNLRAVLMTPILVLGADSAMIPLGESSVIKVEALQPDAVTVEISDKTIASVDLKSNPGNLEIKGLAVGRTQATVKCGECKVVVDVCVKKYAGSTKPITERAVVTGTSPDRELIAMAVEDAARRSVVLEPGARILSIHPKSRPEQVPQGETRSLSVSVHVCGDQYLSTRLNVPITVENRCLPRAVASSLLYSNSPERVSKYQVLFNGEINPGKRSTRLLYHHQNEMGRRIGFMIDVVNYSTKPMTLHLIEGVSDPMLDTVIVGYKAGDEFLANYLTGTGRIVEIPAESRRVLVSQCISAGYTASGILELHEISGESGLVEVVAKPEDERVERDPTEVDLPAHGFSPDNVTMSKDVYPSPAQKMHATYTAGSRWLFMRLGDHPLKCAGGKELLYGNYGVTCDIQLKLENPTSEQKAVELAFEAPAGPASGIFVIDGKVEKVRMLLPPKEVSIGRFVLPAGNNRVVNMCTMPLSGSAYPATIIVRPAGIGSAFLKGK